jgi:hypothetical protein
MDPITAATSEILKVWGPFGALLVIAGIVISRLYTRINDLQDKRLTEVKEYAQQNAELTRDLTKTTDGLTQAVNNLRDLVLTTRGKQGG